VELNDAMVAEIDRLRAELAATMEDRDLWKRSAQQFARDVESLRAELAARDTKPDCRTCDRYIPPLSFAGEPACEFSNRESILVCINGDAYIAADPVRLYDTARKGEGE